MSAGSRKPKLDFTQRRYQQVIDTIQDAVIIDDAAGHVVYANKVFLALFGLQEDDLEGLVLEDYVAPEWRSGLRDRHDARVRGEPVPSFFEYEGIKSTGQRMWLQVSVLEVYDDDGELFGTQSAIRDITEQKRTQEALRDSYGLFEKAHDAIVVTDPETQEILDVNDAAAALYGRSRDDLIEARVTALFKVPEESIGALTRSLHEEHAPPFQQLPRLDPHERGDAAGRARGPWSRHHIGR